MQRRTPWQLPLALAFAALAGAWLAPAGPAAAQEATPAPSPEAPAEDEDDARLTALGGAMAAECYTACGFVPPAFLAQRRRSIVFGTWSRHLSRRGDTSGAVA